jgi:dihydroorotate dehydrogenase
MAGMSLVSLAFAAARPLLHSCDPETAHLLSIRALKHLPATHYRQHDPILSQSLFGLTFPSPVGLAAGFDKNAEVPAQMLGFGFGFVEVGTVTPRPQYGNPKPRVFRLVEDEAVINRMGFNNEGHQATLARLKQRPKGIVGVNVGANKDSADRIADYVAGIENFHPYADYITINISSPNTPGLRGMQSARELEQLLSRIVAARTACRSRIPLLLKIAPDLNDEELSDIANVAKGMVEGVIISNTTLSRTGLSSHHRGETGGLSGKPLFDASTRILAKFRVLTKGAIPLIGVGGISDAETAWQKMRAGASLIQLYSALVYKGPGLAAEISKGLADRMRRESIKSLSQVIGIDAEAIAHQSEAGA